MALAALIAFLHLIPPVLGYKLGGWRGLVFGTQVGVICALVFGALIFSVADLLFVFIGAICALDNFEDKELKDLLDAVFFFWKK